MTEVQQKLQSLVERHFENNNNGNYEEAVSVFAENFTGMPEGMDNIVGRQAMLDMLPDLYPKFRTLVFEKCHYFEMLRDDAAFKVDFVKRVDDSNKTLALYHLSCLWKKIDGKWLIERQMFSSRPMPETKEEKIRKVIEAKIAVLGQHLNNRNIEGIGNAFADDAMIVPHQGNIVTGKKAIMQGFKDVLSTRGRTVLEKTYHFELLNETTAYTNTLLKAVDKDGKAETFLRNQIVWKKVGGDWYLKVDVGNVRQYDVPTVSKL